MISNPAELKRVQENWKSVIQILGGLQRTWFAEGVGFNETAPKEAYNLPFVLAYSVLDYALNQLYDQGVFSCPNHNPKSKLPPGLKTKMQDSKTVLPWRDFALVDDGREKRNKVAHEAELQDTVDCRRYISAVESELQVWGILV